MLPFRILVLGVGSVLALQIVFAHLFLHQLFKVLYICLQRNFFERLPPVLIFLRLELRGDILLSWLSYHLSVQFIFNFIRCWFLSIFRSLFDFWFLIWFECISIEVCKIESTWLLINFLFGRVLFDAPWNRRLFFINFWTLLKDAFFKVGRIFSRAMLLLFIKRTVHLHRVLSRNLLRWRRHWEVLPWTHHVLLFLHVYDLLKLLHLLELWVQVELRALQRWLSGG